MQDETRADRPRACVPVRPAAWPTPCFRRARRLKWTHGRSA